MIVFYDEDRTQPKARLHPYAAAEPNQSGYVDFTQHPDLIESSLEDFRAFAHTPAIQVFYDFLRWINGPASYLATCDCVLRAPTIHDDSNSGHRLCVHGRVYILFRHLQFNSSLDHSDWLCGKMKAELEGLDPSFPVTRGVVSLTKQPALQVAISNGISHRESGFEPGENDPGFGHHLMLTFWAYGDTEDETLGNLERLFRSIWSASKGISDFIGQAQISP